METQPPGVRHGGRRGARIPHHRQPVQRPRHQLDVRQPGATAAREAGPPAGCMDARPRHLAERAQGHRAHPGQPHALPGRDRRAGTAGGGRHRAPGGGGRARAALLRGAAGARGHAAAAAVRSPERGAAQGEGGGRLAAHPAPALRCGHWRAVRGGRRAAQGLAGPARGPAQRAICLLGARTRNHRQQFPRIAESSADSQDRHAPRRGLGRAAVVPDAGESARRLSLHRRRLSVSARGRRPDPHVRGGGHAGAHQPALPLPGQGPPGRAPVHRLRLGHPLRRGPAHAPRHLRQGRQLRGLDRHPGRHEEAVLGLRPVRADDLRFDDHQRPGADDPGLFHERGRRPAGGAVFQRERPVVRGGEEDQGLLQGPRAARVRGRAARRQRRPGPGVAGADRRAAHRGR